MCGVIIIALILDSFRTALFSGAVDKGFDIVIMIMMSLFFFEIIIYLIHEEDYFNSFDFYLDTATTLLFVFDL